MLSHDLAKQLLDEPNLPVWIISARPTNDEQTEKEYQSEEAYLVYNNRCARDPKERILIMGISEKMLEKASVKKVDSKLKKGSN